MHSHVWPGATGLHCADTGHAHRWGKLSWAALFQNFSAGWPYATFKEEHEFKGSKVAPLMIYEGLQRWSRHPEAWLREPAWRAELRVTRLPGQAAQAWRDPLMPFTSHYEHAYSAQHLAVTECGPPSRWAANSRTLGLDGRLADRHCDTELARAGPAGAKPGVTNYSKS